MWPSCAPGQLEPARIAAHDSMQAGRAVLRWHAGGTNSRCDGGPGPPRSGPLRAACMPAWAFSLCGDVVCVCRPPQHAAGCNMCVCVCVVVAVCLLGFAAAGGGSHGLRKPLCSDQSCVVCARLMLQPPSLPGKGWQTFMCEWCQRDCITACIANSAWPCLASRGVVVACTVGYRPSG